MKRVFTLLLSAALMVSLLTGCQGNVPAESDAPSPSASARQAAYTALELAEIALARSGYDTDLELERLDPGSDRERLSVYLERAYGLDGVEWEDAAILRATGASALEVAVLRLRDADAADTAETALRDDYIPARTGDFTGYAPAEAEMAENGAIRRLETDTDDWLALFICPDPTGADDAFVQAVSGEAPPAESAVPEPARPTAPLDTTGMGQEHPEWEAFDPPNQDDMSLYDTSAIREAWAKDDPSGLSEYDRAIYDSAKSLLSGLYSQDSASDLEKETSVFKWMVHQINYDWTHQDVMAETPRESFTPYGGLVNRTAVCLGYATTFQLLMDLAGVECITVVGASEHSQEDHAWNMVRLNGSWYCVDVTWDANLREYSGMSRSEYLWQYFNVTSEYMALNSHQWDYVNTPEAVTEGQGR